MIENSEKGLGPCVMSIGHIGSCFCLDSLGFGYKGHQQKKQRTFVCFDTRPRRGC